MADTKYTITVGENNIKKYTIETEKPCPVYYFLQEVLSRHPNATGLIQYNDHGKIMGNIYKGHKCIVNGGTYYGDEDWLELACETKNIEIYEVIPDNMYCLVAYAEHKSENKDDIEDDKWDDECD